jgi:beta-glucosidase
MELHTRRILLLFALVAASSFAQEGVFMNTRASIDDRVKDLVGRLTLEEKIDMLGGTGFDSKPVPRLNIPAFKMTDGPLGVRTGNATAFPAGIAMAATWDTDLIHRIGVALGEEVIGKGRNTLLGPCVNIQRVPHGGRNFESFGEDPFLTARLATAYIKGVQTTGVIATVKHFAVNNQETNRDRVNVKVSERALREIYLPAFEASVKEAGVWAVMDAYNKVNGWFCTANKHLNIDILKNEWGFKGIIMSDWGATHNTGEAANGGLDIEMPKGEFLNKSLLDLVHEGKVLQATIDDKVSRMLRTMMASGIFDNPATSDSTLVDSPAHRRLNREAGRASIVLLKNEKGMLPLNAKKLRAIAVIGPNASTLRVGGGGSSMIDFTYAVSPLEGIRAAAGHAIVVRYAQGCRMAGEVTPIDSTLLHPSADRTGEFGLMGEYFANPSLSGTPAVTRVDPRINFNWMDGPPHPAIGNDNFSVRWTGVLVPRESGNYTFQVGSDDGSRLYLDDRLLIDDWTDHALLTNSANVSLENGKAYKIRLEYYEHGGAAIVQLGLLTRDEHEYAEAERTAAASDAAIVCVGLSFNQESEGFDRKTLELPPEQVGLIKAVVRANPRTVVVLNSGAPVLMSDWLGKVPVLVEQWFPGQEGGNALADILFGMVSPSGKLPCTFPKRWEDCSAYGSFPGTAEETEYADDIFIGYRHFDARMIEPLFPFGFGLAYTTFEYKNLRVTEQGSQRATVTFLVKNTGPREGAEVAQLYVAPAPSSLPRPPMELKGFKKISLQPGEEQSVTFNLNRRSFAVYDQVKNDWVVPPGNYQIQIGSSSRTVRFSHAIMIQ